ncbi:hypothetical protein GCM10011571_15880 [Marinithermofilum abyssi]|uniref:Uncharacterized protein n=1 Tax=Marinithermofilum abyssi TaxID=1571185 RepID=A0A8J2YCE4_9BACL|nr:hypothetical protein GCM10011571_15880 [Marinithermofilum abyssi]
MGDKPAQETETRIVIGIIGIDDPAEIVFGQVDYTGGRIHIDGLVRKKAHLPNRGPGQCIFRYPA